MNDAWSATKTALGDARALIIVWVMFGIDALAILITYTRLPATDFYHVSDEGLRGGAGRALVFSNFPLALAALAIIGVATLRLHESPLLASYERRLAVSAIALVAALLCLATALPGVVDQDDLDAKLVNLIPALGVVLALGLTATAIRHGNWRESIAWDWRDRFGAMLLAILAIVSLPWFLAEIGVYIDEVPVIGRFFIASEIPPGETLASVHLGHHHGLDGYLFVATALLLGRLIRTSFNGRLVSWVRVYLALMFTYGFANLASDAWLEQLVKRGWLDWRIPSFLRPEVSPAWGVLIASTIVVWYLLFRRRNPITGTEQTGSAINAKEGVTWP